MTSECLPDRWGTRDFPVLMAAARRLDADPEGHLDANVLAEDTGLEFKQVITALDALGDRFLLTRALRAAGRNLPVRIDVYGITERGRRAVGIWPSGEGVDALVDALRQAEDNVDDLEEKTLIRRAAGALGSVSRDVMVDVMAAVIARQSGMG